MEPIICRVCKKTNHTLDGHMIIAATFAQKYIAQKALQDIEKAHILPLWSCIFSCDEILDRTFPGLQTLVVMLHGIKDICQLQSLYVESMCKSNMSLTVDVISSKSACEMFLKKLQN